MTELHAAFGLICTKSTRLRRSMSREARPLKNTPVLCRARPTLDAIFELKTRLWLIKGDDEIGTWRITWLYLTIFGVSCKPLESFLLPEFRVKYLKHTRWSFALWILVFWISEHDKVRVYWSIIGQWLYRSDAELFCYDCQHYRPLFGLHRLANVLFCQHRRKIDKVTSSAAWCLRFEPWKQIHFSASKYIVMTFSVTELIRHGGNDMTWQACC